MKRVGPYAIEGLGGGGNSATQSRVADAVGSSGGVVGSFDRVGVRQLDGKFQFDPMVYKIMSIYKAQRVPITNSSQASFRPRALDGIPFDIQPRPAFVPKRSIGSSFLSRF